jgi:hypothetical protein
VSSHSLEPAHQNLRLRIMEQLCGAPGNAFEPVSGHRSAWSGVLSDESGLLDGRGEYIECDFIEGTSEPINHEALVGFAQINSFLNS